MAQQPLVGQGLLIIADSWSHFVLHTTLSRTPGGVTSKMQKPLSDNTQQAARFEPKFPEGEVLQTHAHGVC
jgi:hypothetical protein